MDMQATSSDRLVLITGGCGFVGRQVVKAYLHRGASLLIVDDLSTGRHPDQWLEGFERQPTSRHPDTIEYRKGEQSVHVALQDALTLFQMGAQGKGLLGTLLFSDVIHLAAIVRGRMVIDGDPLLVANDLALDASMFVWASRDPKRIGRILFASSSAAYPTHLQEKTGHLALQESFIAFERELGLPDMTYGWSKVSGEYLARIAHKHYGLHVACVRPFSGYGEEQDLDYPVPSIALRAAKRENPLVVWGDGLQGRDFIHIDDCVDAMLFILDQVKDGSGVNIGTGILTNFLEVARLFAKLEGYDPEIKPLVDKPVGVASRYADVTLLNGLGWRPKISIEQGFQRVLQAAHQKIDVPTVPVQAARISPSFSVASPRPMNMHKHAIVTTTINVPVLLKDYVEDIKRHGRENSVSMIVIGDKKTPPETAAFCQALAKESGMSIEYLDTDQQEVFLRPYPELRDHLPYNTIARRNIGILKAYTEGYETITTIDDDNFLHTPDFIGKHTAFLGEAQQAHRVVRSSSGWHNICDQMVEEHGIRFFHRGYAPNARWIKDEKTEYASRKGRVMVSAGLWLGDPDVDAVSRLFAPINATGSNIFDYLSLDIGTWCPFNSQNTALHRSVIPAYFLSPTAGRYDDIWASYVVKRIADHLGDLIRYGEPLVKQNRNVHDYWKDLDKEREGYRLTDYFCETLRGMTLTGTNYIQCYQEVIEQFERAFASSPAAAVPSSAVFLSDYLTGMKVWAKIVRV